MSGREQKWMKQKKKQQQHLQLFFQAFSLLKVIYGMIDYNIIGKIELNRN